MKTKHFRRCCLFGALFFAVSLFAQTTEQEDFRMLADRIEDLLSQSEEEQQIDLTDIMDAIDDLQQRPVLINSSDPNELSRLFFLDEMKIHKILAYTLSYGKIMTTNELYAIDGITKAEADLIVPFISLDQMTAPRKTGIKELFTRGKHQIIGRYQRVLQEQRGYMADSIAKTMKYEGNPDKYYLRYRYKFRDQMSIGITAEKDPGEAFFKGNNAYGFDFYSIHFFLNNKNSNLQQLAVGDYHLTFGQGLTMWTTYAFGRASDGVSIKRTGKGLSPNTSANEVAFFRGAAATYKIKNHYITAFVSYHKVDATIKLNPDSTIASVTSLTTDGLHRTATEQAKKHVEPETVFGIHYEWRKNRIKIGATGFGTQLKYPLMHEARPYYLYSFSGQSLGNAGLDFTWIFRNIELFGEGAYSSKGGMAAIGGLRAHLASRFEASLAIRYYEKDYVNIFANALGVNSNNINEMGIFAGFNAIISPQFTLAGYVDSYRFPYMKYQIYAPTHGNDCSLQLNFVPNRLLSMSLRYRNNYREYSDNNNVVKQTSGQRKNNIRWQGNFSVSKNIALKTNAEYVITNSNVQKEGFLMYQDFVYRTPNSRFTATFRYAWFNTDSYDERMYAYESDLLYIFSVPAYYYKGNRFYVMCSYKINEHITAWLRMSNTSYFDRQTIGSGGEEIYGNNKADIRAQIIIKL
jgi:hypothetical protein